MEPHTSLLYLHLSISVSQEKHLLFIMWEELDFMWI